MSDEDLEVLVTLDDPWYGPDEDIFHHLQSDTGSLGGRASNEFSFSRTPGGLPQ